jgi:predicted nucleic acid-binding protein
MNGNGYLADTNAISEYSRPNPDPLVMHWFQQIEPDRLFASVVTVGEIRRGIEDLPHGKRRTGLELWLETRLPRWFDANLLPVTKNIAQRWGILSIQAKRKGSPLATADGLIAATALEHDLTLVTRNVKDFTGLGVSLLNPWEPQP